MVDFQISFDHVAQMIYVIQILDSKPSDRGPSDLETWESPWIQTIQSKVMAT